jgi:hypothetical protein
MSSIYYVAGFGGQEPSVTTIGFILQNSVTYGGGVEVQQTLILMLHNVWMPNLQQIKSISKRN